MKMKSFTYLIAAMLLVAFFASSAWAKTTCLVLTPTKGPEIRVSLNTLEGNLSGTVTVYPVGKKPKRIFKVTGYGNTMSKGERGTYLVKGSGTLGQASMDLQMDVSGTRHATEILLDHVSFKIGITDFSSEPMFENYTGADSIKYCK